MQGDVANGAKENLGMIPRAIQVVFDSIAGLSCELHVSAIVCPNGELRLLLG